MKVLVMGGTNFNGLALVHELVRRGHDVTVCNRGRSAADLPAGVRRLVADREDPDSVRAALSGTEWDAVYDITAYHPGDVAVMIELLAGRVGHYLFASSTVTYATSDRLPITESHPDDRTERQNEYGLHKLLCEDLLWQAHDDHGFPATSVAFSMVFGPHNMIPTREQAMFARLHEGRPILVPGDGETLLQVGHVDDQAAALAELMGREVAFGRRYNLTGREYVTRNRYVATLAAAAGVDDPDVRHIPHDRMEALWTGDLLVDLGDDTGGGLAIRPTGDGSAAPRRSRGRQRFMLAQLVQHLAPNLHHWNRSTVFSIEALRADTGWSPRHTLATMAEDTLRWWHDAGPADTPRDWTFEDQLLALV